MTKKRAAKSRFKRSARQFGEKRSPELEEKFLAGLRSGLTPREAAETAGISRATAFNWRRASAADEDGDDDFAARWEAAVDEGTDRLEQEAWRRGVKGVERPVFQGGVEVGRIREFSDTLLVLMMKGRRPERYNTERHEHTGKDGGPVEHKMEVTFVKSNQK